MSTDTTQLEAAIAAIAKDAMDDCFIRDEEVRAEVVRMLIRSGQLVDYVGMKDDIIHYAIEGSPVKKRDPFEVQRPKVIMPMATTPQRRTELTAAAPDVEIVYTEGANMPHTPGAAFRYIHYGVAMSIVSHCLGTVLDVGGNYAKHAKAERRKYSVHSCNKRVVAPEPEGELEWHRHKQRDVDLQISASPEPDYCIGGAENCHVKARHGVCVHAIYDIDPQLWPTIFRNHELEFVVVFLHYDVAMEVDDVGYMSGPGMHWARVEDNVIQAHFENDSSHPYTHRRDWWLKYGRSWTITEPDWDYVLYYEVEHTYMGNVKASFTKMRKDTLGKADMVPQFRYIDIDEYVDLTVPFYDPAFGKSVNDPHAYRVKEVRVSMQLFAHVMKFGISNDTERPDLPLTFDRVRDECHTFNHVRKISGTSVTVPWRLGTEAINDVARGMYLLIVERKAMNQVKYGAYTDNMQRIQKRWGDESIAFLAAKAFTYAALAPFILLADSVSDVTELLVASMRQQVSSDLMVMRASDVVPYRVMHPVRAIGGDASEQLVSVDPGYEDNYLEGATIEPQKFYDIYKDTLTPEQRIRVEKYLETIPASAESTEVVETAEQVAIEQEIAPPVDEVVESRDKWIAEYEKFEDELEVEELPPRKPLNYTFSERTDGARVWSYAREAMREYQLHNLDVGLHTLMFAKDYCRKTWAGDKPHHGNVRDVNIQLDLGVHYFKLVDGVIPEMDSQSRYAMVIDPITLEHRSIDVSKAGECSVRGIRGDYVFTCEVLRIFNSFAIAMRIQKLLKRPWKPMNIRAVLIDGVPGCGKTYSIIQRFTIRDVLITTVRETRDATYQEMVDGKFADHADVLTKRVRTADSACMHGLPVAKTLYADEGLMAHGAVPVIAALESSASKEFVMFGDSTQITFIDRGSKLGTLHFESLFYWTQIIEQNESVRCPADAMWVSSQFYPAERRPRIKTYSPIMRSIRYIHEPNQKSPVWSDIKAPWITVSILRGDMDDLVARDSSTFVKGTLAKPGDTRVPVYSVHEVQGRTKPFVRAVRITPFNPDVVNSPAHANVMFTRHTLRMDYVSSRQDPEDRNSFYAKAAMALSDDELRAMMLPTPEWLQERMRAQLEKYEKHMV